MKQLLLISILLIYSSILFGQATNQNKSIETLPQTLLHTNAVIRSSKTSYVLLEENKLKESIENTISILDNEGLELSYVIFPYDEFSKINSGKIWIYDASGELIETVSLSKMIDNAYSGSNFYSDNRIKYYYPYKFKPPFTIHYKYEKTYKGFFHLPRWVPQKRNDVHVEKASLEITNEAETQFRIIEHNLIDSLKSFSNSENNYSWELNNIQSFELEKNSPPLSYQLPQIIFPLEQFEIDGYNGSLRSWQEFGKWIIDMNEGLKDIDLETKQYLKSMTDSLDTPEEKAKLIYQWMQDETRYVSIQLGIGGWKPYSPQFVDQNKYGDCKALTYYTKSLLKAIGIDSYYTLVQAGRNDIPIKPEDIFNQFNHVILCIPFQNDTSWLECTSNMSSFGYLGQFTDDRYALLIDENDCKLIKTPKYSINDNLLKRHSTIDINEEGGFNGRLNSEFHSTQSEKRWFQKDENLRDQMDHLYEIIEVKGFNIEELNYDFIDDKHPIVYEQLGFSARQVAKTTSSKIFVPLYYLNKKPKKLKSEEDRRFEIVLKRGSTSIDTIVFNPPPNYTIKSIPEHQLMESDFGFYESKTWIQDNQIYYYRKEIVKDGRFPPERWEDFKTYKNAVRKADKATAVLEKTN